MDDSGDITTNNKDRKRGIEYVLSKQIENPSSESTAKKIKIDQKHRKANPKIEKDIDDRKDVFFLLVSKIPYQWSCEKIADFINENCIDVYALEQLEGGDEEAGQKIRLTFTDFKPCKNARRQLKLKSINGRKLDVTYIIPGETDSDDEMDKPLSQRRFSRQSSLATSCQSSVDIWADDPTGTYGLKLSYLKMLGIIPPIHNWVYVSNFRCDKSELKEALELAGHVVVCRVIHTNNKYALVMYSHPLEAVQAVTMLNGQKFYGQALKVLMYKCDNKEILLPKGLLKVGPGLGIDGTPLRDITQQFERYLNGKTNRIDETLFNISSNNTEDDDLNINVDIKEDNNESMYNDNAIEENSRSNFTSMRQSHVGNNADTPVPINPSSIPVPINPNSTTVPINPSSIPVSINPSSIPVSINPSSIPVPLNPSSTPVLQNGTSNIYQSNQPIPRPLENSFSSGIKPNYTMPVGNNVPTQHLGPQNVIVGPQPRQIAPTGLGGQQPYPKQIVALHIVNRDPRVGDTNGWAAPSNMSVQRTGTGPLPQKTTSVVELSNLPLSTTFPILSEKMAQVGQVISLQLTRVGCAVVHFATPTHAERCYLHYNKMFVMGNHIEVKFI